MAFNTPKSFTSAVTNDSILNTPPTARLLPENMAEDVLSPASFSLDTTSTPIEQKKLSAPTPPGLCALRACVADLDQQLSIPSLGHPSPSSPEPVIVIDDDETEPLASGLSPQTPMVINIPDDSPPPAPFTRRLRRQNAVIDLTLPSTTPVTRPKVSAHTALLHELQSLRRRLNYDEEEETYVIMEEDDLETDVTMEEEDTEMEQGDNPVRIDNLPVSPVLMAVKALAGIINEVVHESCDGCTRNYPSQMDHEDCMWLEWPQKVDKYFDRAISKLDESRFFQFFNQVYNVQVLFEEEQDLCVGEASEFYHVELPKRGVQMHVKSKMREM
ncbi:uncharacterized protein LOC121409661 [Lytechinus variegatus]|uniref:uncharacterized protein LOC121409661 n=1 Tax=Lytechinus variegatus TaxID=7654 RepID=UPI001BB16B25|nr:uncharacterized protein LOC121409661 [Lytechinus variegatus]